MMRYLNYIGGEWIDCSSRVVNVNPSDVSEQIGEICFADEALAGRAIETAAEAAKSWNHSPIEQRADILQYVGQRLLDNRETYGRLLSQEQGKILAEGIGEVERAARIFLYFAGESIRLHGQSGDSTRANVEVRVDRFAIGTVGLITPWNFPIAIPAWKIAPALAFGNTVVLKPAQITPGCADILARLLHEAGVPPGVFNLVHGSGREVGDALVRSPAIDGLSFTGSEGVGRQIRLARAELGKACQLELGGKNPLIIADDADLDTAVSVATSGSFGGTGQKCTASSRIIVMDGIYDEFVEAFCSSAMAINVGHALHDGIDMGPLADENQMRSVQGFIQRASDEGAEIIGGATPTTEFDGFYVQPAIFLNAKADTHSSREEIFGPCASIFKAATFEEAIAMSNETRFGLSSGVCTTSLRRANQFRREIKTGLAMVNLPTAGVDYHVPFGGVKASAHGPKEQGSAALDFYTRLKTTYTKS